jgi:large subunit ribosomal protein L32
VIKCDKCLQPKLPHRVCPHCGHYAGRHSVDVEEF